MSVLLGVGVAAAQEPHLRQLREKAAADLDEIEERSTGILGVKAIDLTSGTGIGVNEDLVFPQASAIKVTVLLELFRRGDDDPSVLRSGRPVGAADQVGGSGISRYFGAGTSTLSLEDLAVLMIVLSDNTATNILIDELGMESINRTAGELGLEETALQRKMMQFEAAAAGRDNLSTPAEAAEIMARIHSCRLPLSADACDRVRDILEIPKEDPFRRAIPDGVPVAFKSGWSGGIRAVWALVGLEGRPFAVAAMTNYADDVEKDRVIEEVSAALYRYFSRLAGATPFGGRVPVEMLEGDPGRPHQR